MLSELFSEYELTQRTSLAKMSPDQVRKWTSAKKRAVEILIERNGDKGLHELTRDDALSYADWWEDRVIIERLEAGTANKNISHISGMIRAVNKRHDLRLDAVFAGTRIGGGKDGSRKPFDVDFITNVILADGQLANLNDEARDIVYTLIETGARPSEIINLSQHCIVLDAPIPHIRIMADRRRHPARQQPGGRLHRGLRHVRSRPARGGAGFLRCVRRVVAREQGRGPPDPE
jgi:integrase